MESKSELKPSNGRILVAVFLALIGCVFALAAALGEPSPSRVAFTVLAVVMIAGAGAALALAVAAAKGREQERD
ncbi:MAG: hypothetical protein WC972_06340 [Trueperaceae bacterium]|jgi:drug/metabolite transporter (DMT)-like permease|nr:hypothetical protein [Trueperaceae bacterium]HRQ10452.1 hypothetical protein [Trueperaceae bacterium]